jgi:NADH-quinone oxidoreductase subunit E
MEVTLETYLKASTNPNTQLIADVDTALLHHNNKRSHLIGILQEIQEKYHYLPESALNQVAKAIGVSPTTVYGVATFYAQFSLDPKGKYLVRICDGTACHIKNSPKVYERLHSRLHLQDDKTTSADGLFTLETVACLGACGIAPVMVINDVVYPQITPDAAEIIVDKLAEREVNPAEAQS